MIIQYSETYSDIVAPMNQAFESGNFYGLEYILDQLVTIKPMPAHQDTIDWFGATDYFA